jgi:hypothetical protein
MDPADEWVELVRMHDRVQADITARFLEDHDVRVRTSGGANSALPTLGLTDVRLLVPRESLERAEQALAAMREGRSDEHPFRDQPPEPYEAPVAKKKAPFAVMLAVLVPVGGGHFYARHGAAGAILAAGIVGGFLASVLWAPSVVYTCGFIVLLDAAFAPLAVRRANASRIPSESRQRLWALAAVVVAWLLALAADALLAPLAHRAAP